MGYDIKDLFREKKTTKVISNKSLEDFTTSTFGSAGDIESADYLHTRLENYNRYIPPIDFEKPEKFARFGSAQKYYEDSINRIANTYPYDGSKKEKEQWFLSSSYLDIFIFNKKYPKSTGYVNFSSAGWGSRTAVSNLYGTPVDKEYIYFHGGPHTAQKVNDRTHAANKYDESNYRETNLKIDPARGNTVEFWLKKAEFVGTDKTQKEVVLDVWTPRHDIDNESYGRLLIELDSEQTATPFKITLVSGSVGITNESVGDSLTPASIADNEWHHYAFTFIFDDSQIATELYIDGKLNSKKLTSISGGTEMGSVTSILVGSLGALGIKTTPTGTETLGAGKLLGSIDEFRYWKTKRSGKEIGRYYNDNVGAGTNTDDSNTDLGIYFKFNEGITTITSLDSTILDYSGRISNGSFYGYNVTARDTGSAVSEFDSADFERSDPIIYLDHPRVSNLKASLIATGSSHDYRNNSSLLYSMPSWLIDSDFSQKDTNLFKLTQIIGSYCDTLFMQIEQLPLLKNLRYRDYNISSTVSGSKPTVLGKDLLESKGFVTPEIFMDAELLELLDARDDNIKFEENINDLRNFIYKNIYNNLVNINKTKGTEHSFRNLIRCFGVDDELIKLNTYATNYPFYLKDNRKYTVAKTKAIDFNEETHVEATIHQYRKDDKESDYIGASYDDSSCTVEFDVLFPKKHRKEEKTHFHNDFLTASIGGMHTPANLNTGDYSVAATDYADLQVAFVKSSYDESSGKFRLYATSGNKVIPTLTSSEIPFVYENTRWNISVRVKPHASPYVDAMVTSELFDVEFSGYNYISDSLQNQFKVTGSITGTNAASFNTSNKRLFVGSHRTNFEGSVRQKSDVQISGLRYWQSYLTDEEIQYHAKDLENIGVSNPAQNPFLFETTPLQGKDIYKQDTLALNWTFDTVTGSDASGQFRVEDVTTGSSDYRYGQEFNFVKTSHPGIGYGFNNLEITPVEGKYFAVARQNLPEYIYNSDMVSVVDADPEVFTRDSRPQKLFFSFEKSMYQTVSEEMLKFVSSVIEFNNLIGEPINRYRQEYKGLQKLKQLFFEKVKNTPDLDKFVEYYKWLDSALSIMIDQLKPLSETFSEDIRNVVENYVFDRNKYWTKFPTLEAKFEDKIWPILGVNELLYDWEHGHAPPPVGVTSATATLTFDVSTFDDINNGTITLTDASETSVTYTIRQSGAAPGPPQFNCGGSRAAAAENLAQAIEHADGHNGTIYATDSSDIRFSAGSYDFSDGVVKLKQATAGTAGNTIITTAANFDNTTSVNVGSTFTEGTSRPSESVNLLWWQQRADRTGILTSGDSKVDADKEVIKRHINRQAHEGATYALRRFTKPYKFSVERSRNLLIGDNPDSNKLHELHKGILRLGKDTSITFNKGSIEPDKVTRDVIDPTKKKKLHGRADVEGTNNYMDADVNLIAPFTLVSSSVDTGYLAEVRKFQDGFSIENLHTKKYYESVPLQGVFPETWVGGFPHQRESLLNEDLDYSVADFIVGDVFDDIVSPARFPTVDRMRDNALQLYMLVRQPSGQTRWHRAFFRFTKLRSAGSSWVPASNHAQRDFSLRDMAIRPDEASLPLAPSGEEFFSYAINRNLRPGHPKESCQSLVDAINSASKFIIEERQWIPIVSFKAQKTSSTTFKVFFYGLSNSLLIFNDISGLTAPSSTTVMTRPIGTARAEQWKLEITSDDIKLVHPGYDVPRSDYSAEDLARRPVNIKNIPSMLKTNNLGNYMDILEVVQTTGRESNNTALIKDPDYKPLESVPALEGLTDYAPVDRTVSSRHVIANKFDAGIGPAQNFVDYETEEYSPYNCINYRNLKLRKLLDKSLAEPVSSYGTRDGTKINYSTGEVEIEKTYESDFAGETTGAPATSWTSSAHSSGAPQWCSVIEHSSDASDKIFALNGYFLSDTVDSSISPFPANYRWISLDTPITEKSVLKFTFYAGSTSDPYSLEEPDVGDPLWLQYKISNGEWKTIKQFINSPTPATATLNCTTDIVLTSVEPSAGARSGKTFQLDIKPAAANPTNTILANWVYSSGNFTLEITPNDGTNNSSTAVSLTTQQIVELINTDAVSGKSVTVADSTYMSHHTSATGGDSTSVVNGGEGDVTATFAGGSSGQYAGKFTEVTLPLYYNQSPCKSLYLRWISEGTTTSTDQPTDHWAIKNIIIGPRIHAIYLGAKHSTFRNVSYEATSGSSVACIPKVEADNYFVRRIVPSSELQYRWIKDCTTDTTASYFGYHHNYTLPSGSSSTYKKHLSFITASEFGTFVFGTSTGWSGRGRFFGYDPPHGGYAHTGYGSPEQFIPIDAAGLNTNIYEPVDLLTNTLGYSSLSYDEASAALLQEGHKTVNLNYVNQHFVDGNAKNHEETFLGFHNDSPYGDFTEGIFPGMESLLNSLLIHRKGLSGYPSWRQLREASHPIAKAQRAGNYISFDTYTNDSKWVKKDEKRKSYFGGLDISLNPTSRDAIVQGSVTPRNLREPALFSKYKPIYFDFGSGERADNEVPLDNVRGEFSCWFRYSRKEGFGISYGNDRVQFHNPVLRQILNEDKNKWMYSPYREDFGRSAYKDVIKLLSFTPIEGAPAAAASKPTPIHYYETVFPQGSTTYLKEVRGRTGFKNYFWHSERGRRDVIRADGHNFGITPGVPIFPWGSNPTPVTNYGNWGITPLPILARYESEMKYRSNSFGVAHVDSKGTSGDLVSITSSFWPLDARKNFETELPSDLTNSYVKPGIRATATLRFDASTFDDVDEGTITLINAAETSVTYTIRQAGAAPAVPQFNCGGSRAAAAENLAQAIEHALGHNGTIHATDSNGVRFHATASYDFSDGIVELVQATAGLAGNTTITTADNFDNTTNVNAGSAFVGGDGSLGFLNTRLFGKASAGELQNDYSIYHCGINNLHGVPTPGLTYNRKELQKIGDKFYLAGEAKWEAGSQAGKSPFYDSYSEYSKDIRTVGQNHGMISEFIMGNHIYDIIHTEEGDVWDSSIYDYQLSLTGAEVYNDRQPEPEDFPSGFGQLYSFSDFLKFFDVVKRDAEMINNLSPTRLSIRCRGVMKLLPYDGFYPATRVTQMASIFAQEYISPDVTNWGEHDEDEVVKAYVRKKVSGSAAQLMKPVMSPGVLLNSIKTGLAVDYPIFKTTGTGSLAFIGQRAPSTKEELINLAAGNAYDGSAVLGPAAQKIAYASSGSAHDTAEFTGSWLNGTNYNAATATGGRYDADYDDWTIHRPRIAGANDDAQYTRIQFEDIMSPQTSLRNLLIYDNEPHPSASLCYGGNSWGIIQEHPYKFASFGPRLEQIYDHEFRRNINLDGYAMAMNNFTAETVNFFLKESKLTVAFSANPGPFAKFDEGMEYRMDFIVENRDLLMYDRRSAFGPEVDTGGAPTTVTIVDQPASPDSGILAFDHVPMGHQYATLGMFDKQSAYFKLVSSDGTSSGVGTTLIVYFISEGYLPSDYAIGTIGGFDVTGAGQTPAGVAGDIADATWAALNFAGDPTQTIVRHIEVSRLNQNIFPIEGKGDDDNLNRLMTNLKIVISDTQAKVEANGGKFRFNATPGPKIGSLLLTSLHDGPSDAGSTYDGILNNGLSPMSTIFGGGAALVEKTITRNHKYYDYSPYVPSFLETNTSPKMTLVFKPAGDALEEWSADRVIRNIVANGIRNETYCKSQENSLDYHARMTLTASFNLGVTDAGPVGDKGKSLFIQPKWETPVLNFYGKDATVFDYQSGATTTTNKSWSPSEDVMLRDHTYVTGSKGMWHQHGSIPTITEGYYGVFRDVENPGPTTGSLKDVLGFPDEVKYGELKDDFEAELGECVVAVPIYYETVFDAGGLDELGFPAPPRGVRTPRMFRIPEEADWPVVRLIGEYFGGNRQNIPAIIRHQMDMMQKYIFPPWLDWIANPKVPAYVMYAFEFKTLLKKQDLADIWQNLPPECARKEEVQDQYVSHLLTANAETALTLRLDDVHWKVFKVKKRARSSYHAVVSDSIGEREFGFLSVSVAQKLGALSRDDEDRFYDQLEELYTAELEDVEEGGREDFLRARARDLGSRKRFYTYNWPHDYFSLVELIKIDSKIQFGSPVGE